MFYENKINNVDSKFHSIAYVCSTFKGLEQSNQSTRIQESWVAGCWKDVSTCNNFPNIERSQNNYKTFGTQVLLTLI